MKENIKNFNHYSYHKIISNLLPYLSIITSLAVCCNIKNKISLIQIYGIILLIFIIFFKKYCISKPIDKLDLKRKYVYHCLSKEKFDKVYNNGIANIYKTTGLWANISTYFKKAVYFHSDMRGISFLYNHGLKHKNIEYILIVPIENLSDNIRIRKIDGAIMDLKNYHGRAKCIPISKFDIYKRISIVHMITMIGDYFLLFLFYNICFIPLLLVFLLIIYTKL